VEANAIAYHALKAAQNGDVETAYGRLETLKGIDAKPMLYWYALSVARSREGNDQPLKSILSFVTKMREYQNLFKMTALAEGPPAIARHKDFREPHWNISARVSLLPWLSLIRINPGTISSLRTAGGLPGSRVMPASQGPGLPATLTW
jgi:hypothetical protein